MPNPTRLTRHRAVGLLALILPLALALVAPASAAQPTTTLRTSDSPLPGMWWYDALQVEKAHKQSTGKGVTIAVIDGPVDTHIPELRGQDVTPVRNYCANPDEDPVATATATGQKAQHATSITALLVGNGHGTGPGGSGIKGIAPDATVRNYVVDESNGGNEEPRCSDKDIDTIGVTWAKAMRAATDDGADVISFSFGTANDYAIHRAVDYALDNDVVVVAAAGNDGGRIDFPASTPGVVSVGMLDETATVDKRSDHGIQLVISAPGVDVATGGYGHGSWSSEITGSGTSFATPLTAGAVALVKAKYPVATNWQLVRHLVYRAGVDKKFDWSEYVGFGAVSANRMLNGNPTRWHDFNPFKDWPPDAFIEYGDNELTGTPEQLALNSPTPTPTATPSHKAPQKSDVAQGRGSETNVARWIMPGAGAVLIALIGGGVGIWSRRRAA